MTMVEPAAKRPWLGNRRWWIVSTNRGSGLYWAHDAAEALRNAKEACPVWIRYGTEPQVGPAPDGMPPPALEIAQPHLEPLE